MNVDSIMANGRSFPKSHATRGLMSTFVLRFPHWLQVLVILQCGGASSFRSCSWRTRVGLGRFDRSWSDLGELGLISTEFEHFRQMLARVQPILDRLPKFASL